MRKKYKTVLKRLSAIAMAIIMIFGIAPINGLAYFDWPNLKVHAQAYSAQYKENGYTYKVENGEATIIKYVQPNSSLSASQDTVLEELVIPETLGGYPVVSLSPESLPYPFSSIFKVKFKKVVIPRTVRTIGSCAFGYQDELLSVTIPNNVKTISIYAFNNCKKLKEVSIPMSVEIIDSAAFMECTSIENIAIPDSVKVIGGAAFSGCSRLKSIVLPKNINAINDITFSGCGSLEAIDIPESVTQIGDGAFSECASLRTIKIPEAVKVIGEGAFCSCTALDKIYIPAGVESIAGGFVSSCTNMKEIIVDANNKNYKSADGILLNKAGDTIIQYPNGRLDKTYTVPKNVLTIGRKSFLNCKKLENIEFHHKLVKICDNAFNGCSNLNNVILPYTINNDHKLGSGAFKNIKGLNIFISGVFKCTDYDHGWYDDGYPFDNDVNIHGKKGSYAQRLASEIGGKFTEENNPVTSIKFDKSEVTINRNDSFSISADIEPMNFTDDVHIKSSNSDVVNCAAFQGAVVYAHETGTAILKLYSGNVSGECKVKVVEPVSEIILPQSLDICIGTTAKIKAKVLPDNAYNKELKWVSSNPSIVTVDEKTGEITPLKEGVAVITAYTTDGSYGRDPGTGDPIERNASCTINVIKPNSVNSTEGFESKHNYDNNVRVSWVYKSKGAENITLTFDTRTSVEEDFDFIYILDKNGQEVGRFTGKELAGESVKVMGDTVEVKLVADQSINDWGFKVTDIKLNAKKQTPLMSGTKIYNKNEDDADFNLDINTNSDGLITYKSSNPNVATVDSNGNVKILGQGNTTITVTSAETKDFKSTDMVVEVNVGVGGGLNITSQPQNFYGHKNEKATFTVHAYGDGLKYQWQYSDNRGKTWLNTYAKGSATNSITVNMDAMRVDRLFRCKITDKYGDAVYSDVVIMALKKSDIDIVSQPKSYSGKSFDAVRFHVEAQGENLTYRWLCSSDGGKTWKKTYLLGYNTDTLKVRLFKHRENTMYKCVITSAGENSVETTVATLTKKS